MSEGSDWSIHKVPTGIEGLDDITNGGFPHGRNTLIMGGPGAGKTVLALQTLVNGARFQGEPGIFVAFEENSRRVIANAATFGWDLLELEKKHLFFLDAQIMPDVVAAGEFDIQGILATLGAKAEQMGARRIVFDSIDVLLALLRDPVAEQREMLRLHHWLAKYELTGIVTTKTRSAAIFNNELIGFHQYDFLQFMADCVVQLTHRVQDHVSQRYLRVLKYRGSGFAENEVPILIGHQGFEVASIGSMDFDYPVSNERISSGVAELDEMLVGGFYRGTSILITGAPGTAKSTISGSFAAATCARGERALYISFDEGANEIMRNLASVNIQLEAFRDQGLLLMISARSEARSSEEHLIQIRRLIDEHNPQMLIIDPMSAIVRSGGEVETRQITQRLIYHTKLKGITTVCTSLLDEVSNMGEASRMQISTIADGWMHLSYMIHGGERNRALTVIKARGIAHTDQVRELILSDAGIRLAEVYTAGGEVLMGTLRWEKEERERQDARLNQFRSQQKQRELRASEAAIQARIEALKAELAVHQSEIGQLSEEQRYVQTERVNTAEKLRQLRGD